MRPFRTTERQNGFLAATDTRSRGPLVPALSKTPHGITSKQPPGQGISQGTFPASGAVLSQLRGSRTLLPVCGAVASGSSRSTLLSGSALLDSVTGAQQAPLPDPRPAPPGQRLGLHHRS